MTLHLNPNACDPSFVQMLALTLFAYAKQICPSPSPSPFLFALFSLHHGRADVHINLKSEVCRGGPINARQSPPARSLAARDLKSQLIAARARAL